MSIEYNQSLNVTQEELQSQETIIVTDQNQSFKTENKTDYVDQTLKTEIETHQKGEIDLEKNINKNSQKTTVLTEQTHESETSGHATFQQQQSVEAIANNEETEAEEVNIKAAVSNGLEIIKEVSHYVVKIFQSIIVNDEKVDSFEGEYIVKNNSSIQKEQKYEQEYEWGILSIFNSITLNTTEDNDLQSVLSSIIKFNYFIQNDKNQDQETPGEEEPENPGEETQGEEEPRNPGEDNQGEEEPRNPGEETQEKRSLRIQEKKLLERKIQKILLMIKHQEKMELWECLHTILVKVATTTRLLLGKIYFHLSLIEIAMVYRII